MKIKKINEIKIQKKTNKSKGKIKQKYKKNK